MAGEPEEEFFPPHLAHLINADYPPTECFWIAQRERAKQVQGHESRSPFPQDDIHTELYRIADFADKCHRMVDRLRDKIADMRRYVERLQARRADICAKWEAHMSHNRGRLVMVMSLQNEMPM